MLHFEGDKRFGLPPAETLAKLGEAQFLVSCIPDVESVTQAESRRAVFVLRPGLSFVRGTLQVTLEITPTKENTIGIVATSKGIGTSSRVQAAMAAAEDEQGTRLHWVADVTELGGLLKAVPRGLLQASAQKVIGDLWTAIEAKMNA